MSDEDPDIIANHHDPETGERVFIRRESSYGTEPNQEPVEIIEMPGGQLFSNWSQGGEVALAGWSQILESLGYSSTVEGETSVTWAPRQTIRFHCGHPMLFQLGDEVGLDSMGRLVAGDAADRVLGIVSAINHHAQTVDVTEGVTPDMVRYPCAICSPSSLPRNDSITARCPEHTGHHGPCWEDTWSDIEDWSDGFEWGLRLGCAERDRVRSEIQARLTRLRTILESEAADPVGLALREMRGWE